MDMDIDTCNTSPSRKVFQAFSPLSQPQLYYLKLILLQFLLDIQPKDECSKHLHEFHVQRNSWSLNLDPEVFPFPVLQMVTYSGHTVKAIIHCTALSTLQYIAQYLLGNLSSWPQVLPPAGLVEGDCSHQQKASFEPPQSFKLEYSLGTHTANLRSKPAALISVGKLPTAAADAKLAFRKQKRRVFWTPRWIQLLCPTYPGHMSGELEQENFKLNVNLRGLTFFDAIWVRNHIREYSSEKKAAPAPRNL